MRIIYEAGYDGHSMSNNARFAYETGEMPLSKWSKSAIINSLDEYIYDKDLDPDLLNICKKLTKDELVELCLTRSSWHHTGALYNRTNFYKLKDNIDFNRLAEFVSNKKPVQKVTRSKEDISKEKDLYSMADDTYRKLYVIYASGVGLKTIKGTFKKCIGSVDDWFRKALEKIKKDHAPKVTQWKKTLPKDHYRQEYVSLFENDMASYAFKYYVPDINRREWLYQAVLNYYKGR